ncbi:methyltransferase domain-containing protein [Microlunatus ginsengisoli]|uniref:Methyltransferase n=1 Tax=Microlunatus ginsengisoli TaxID=363863 RepID=A0ABP7ABF8_9ACTN
MDDRLRRRSVSQSFLLDLLLAQIEQWSSGRPDGAAGLRVVDLGGGTGGTSIKLASLGYRVTVIDPSPDALASLERRTDEAGLVGRIDGRQGDASDLVALLGPAQADLVICHRVLEVVDSPAAALSAVAEVLRPGGALSLVVAQRRSLVLSQALAGHFASARRTWADPDRFDHDQILDLVIAAGLRPQISHGIGAIADHVPEALVEAESGAYSELSQLEREISQDPAFRALAPYVHVFARPA